MSLPILGSLLLYHAPVDVVTPGSTTYSASGNYNFTVPAHNTLVVKVWGPGGSGGSARPGNPTPFYGVDGVAGNDSSWNVATLVSHSGAGGQAPDLYSTYGVAAGGAGGTATGGTVNTTGGPGSSGGVPTGSIGGAGGTGANGGTSGMPPGGGGSGATFSQQLYGGAGGGGGGGYCERTYTIGTYAIGQVVSVVVGAGGVCPDPGGGWPVGGTGALGKVQVSWT